MRAVIQGLAAILLLLIGLGVGYLLWGLRATNLARQASMDRYEYDYQISQAERRAKAAEDRAQQEAKMRRELEDELQRVHPQK